MDQCCLRCVVLWVFSHLLFHSVSQPFFQTLLPLCLQPSYSYPPCHLLPLSPMSPAPSCLFHLPSKDCFTLYLKLSYNYPTVFSLFFHLLSLTFFSLTHSVHLFNHPFTHQSPIHQLNSFIAHSLNQSSTRISHSFTHFFSHSLCSFVQPSVQSPVTHPSTHLIHNSLTQPVTLISHSFTHFFLFHSLLT